MSRAGIACVILAFSITSPLLAQSPSDLQVELRSATGSNRFQIGEVIPLELVLSSSSPNHYLEPCNLFNESHFGFPQCRFSSGWSFSITPDSGWVDLTKEFPAVWAGGGPSFEVPSHDLSAQPQTFPYVLTHRFRFDKPGEYRVQLSIEVALDDASTQRGNAVESVPDAAAKPHTVALKPEVVLEIVPASAEWQREIIRKGFEAYSGPIPPNSNPPSPEWHHYQQATEALCHLDTPDAVRVMVGLLSSQRQEIRTCVDHTSFPEAAVEEMRRRLVDPEASVTSELLYALRNLLGRLEFKTHGSYALSQQAFDHERAVLISALPLKRGDAQASSLLTLLEWPPPPSPGAADDSADNQVFPTPVIAAVVANYDHYAWGSDSWLLGDGWPKIRSPLMIPVVSRLAEAGNGQALLRWMALDPAAATEFSRKEVVRPVPRFSSFYLRLADPLSPADETQLAANFVALSRHEDIARAATLLHRYASSAVLLVVLPFIDAQSGHWPTAALFPTLAYLLKVSPKAASPRVEEVLHRFNHEPWQPTFFSEMGFLQPSPVLERLAMAQVVAGTQPLARDAVDYLQLHGAPAVKPFLWGQLQRWHAQLAGRRANQSDSAQAPDADGSIENVFVLALANAYTNAQAWLLSPEEAERLGTLLGKQWTSSSGCSFSCGASIAIGPSPAAYAITSHSYQPVDRRPEPLEYLSPSERLRYSINQYRCPDLRTLEDKILRFPVGSTFSFAYDFSAADRRELVEISDFLWMHGYKVSNLQKWSFLRPPAPHLAP